MRGGCRIFQSCAVIHLLSLSLNTELPSHTHTQHSTHEHKLLHSGSPAKSGASPSKDGSKPEEKPRKNIISSFVIKAEVEEATTATRVEYASSVQELFELTQTGDVKEMHMDV